MVANKSLKFVKHVPAAEYPVAGEHLQLAESDLDVNASLDDGAILVKTKVLSLDPYMRSRLAAPSPGFKYVPPFELNAALQNFGVGEVIKAGKNASISVGQHVYGNFDFSEYVKFDEAATKQLKVLENKDNIPWTTWVGALGMPGTTAYVGLRDIGKPQKGETIFVSSASGAVGQMVIGLAHKAGAKVIAAAGSDEKVELLKTKFGVEHAFNYKTTDVKEYLSKHEYQMYWDNVAGPTLEAVLDTIQRKGRIIACGAANDYNQTPYGVKNLFNVVAKELHYEGFIVLNSDPSGFYETVPALVADGSLVKPIEHVTKGLDNGEAFVDLLKGNNVGKAVISLE